jgi:cytochrome P450
MAEDCPVWLQESTGHVYVSRYADAREVLLNTSEFSNDRISDRLRRVPDRLPTQCLAAILHDRLVMTDGPHHRALRQRMRESFTAGHVRAYEPMIQRVISETLSAIDWSVPVDFLHQIALPIPSRIILKALGFPEDDFAQLRQWTGDFYNWLAESPGGIEERTQRALDATEHMRDYVVTRLRRPFARAEPGLLNILLDAHDAGDFTQDEVVANLIGIINAAHETTSSLMANAMILLLGNPSQLALVCEDPSLIPSAVTEIGRLESPAQIISRVAATDLEFHGLRLRAGQLVAVNLAQVNRDPDVYPDPDRFEIARPGPFPLTFGYGDHFCIGTALARLETEVLLAKLLPRMTGAEILNDPITWRPTPAFRCPSDLIIAFADPSQVKGKTCFTESR